MAMTYGATSAYTKDKVELLGRRRIYTDATEITEENVIPVLQKALIYHEQNQAEIFYLTRYEKGIQPLKREKKIRDDINIEVSDNIANQIVEFKMGYHWGNPITYVQKNDSRSKALDVTQEDDNGITLLNLYNDMEFCFAKDQQLGRSVEIAGIGYQMVDIKRDYIDGESPFDLNTLDSAYTFIVYRNDVRQTKMMSVTYRELEDGSRYFTCITKDKWFEVRDEIEVANGQKTEKWLLGQRSGEANPFGRVPVCECLRSFDRLGIFERQIPDMDALNIEVSDFANSVAQQTQEIWWMNDADFPVDPQTGEPSSPKTGQWVKTKTAPNGNRPMIQALGSNFNYEGVEDNIITKRNTILQKCYVPLQSEPGGGSTASAMSMSAGWAAAEAVAMAQENITKAFKMEIAALELIAIKKSPFFKGNEAVKNLKLSDIEPKFTRQKTFDLGTKVNAMVTMIKNGVNGRIAMETVDLFPDVAKAWEDSKDGIERYQEAIYRKGEATDKNDRIMSDATDQVSNSPILDGVKTGADYSKGGEV